MTIEITYEFDPRLSNPFVAKTTIRGESVHGLSRLGFEEAKQDLLQVAKRAANAPEVIPEPESVTL